MHFSSSLDTFFHIAPQRGRINLHSHQYCIKTHNSFGLTGFYQPDRQIFHCSLNLQFLISCKVDLFHILVAIWTFSLFIFKIRFVMLFILHASSIEYDKLCFGCSFCSFLSASCSPSHFVHGVFDTQMF